jgi:hypothetical protein
MLWLYYNSFVTTNLRPNKLFIFCNILSQDSWETLFDSLEQFSDDFMESDFECKASQGHRRQPESQVRESVFE